jgi:hypothetical protein
VKKLSWLLFTVLFCALSAVALQEGVHMSPPPPPLDPERAHPTPEQVTLPKHIDLLQLQKEADDLARTAQSIPSDVANVRKGTLPKDVIGKLKQIEKLSKRLRTELNP